MLFLFALCVVPLSAVKPPHVIQILLDDWGYGDISALAAGPGDDGGYPKPNTPSINRLVASGTLMSHWHSGSPVCSPSRLALMTSRFPAEFAFHTAIDGDHAANAALGCADFLPLDTPFLPGLLTKYGNYSTAHFGKCAYFFCWRARWPKTPRLITRLFDSQPRAQGTSAKPPAPTRRPAPRTTASRSPTPPQPTAPRPAARSWATLATPGFPQTAPAGSWTSASRTPRPRSPRAAPFT